jgi:hypothetical protein
MSFESEAEMLKRWTSLVLETDPDIITGDNPAYEINECMFVCHIDNAHVWLRSVECEHTTRSSFIHSCGCGGTSLVLETDPDIIPGDQSKKEYSKDRLHDCMYVWHNDKVQVHVTGGSPNLLLETDPDLITGGNSACEKIMQHNN